MESMFEMLFCWTFRSLFLTFDILMLEKHHQLHIPYTVFTCAKGICFFTCLFAQLCKNY